MEMVLHWKLWSFHTFVLVERFGWSNIFLLNSHFWFASGVYTNMVWKLNPTAKMYLQVMHFVTSNVLDALDFHLCWNFLYNIRIKILCRIAFIFGFYAYFSFSVSPLARLSFSSILVAPVFFSSVSSSSILRLHFFHVSLSHLISLHPNAHIFQ